MKIELKNNQYSNDGSYKFPDKETKVITYTTDMDEFLTAYVEVLGIPKRLSTLFKYIMISRDKGNMFNYLDNKHNGYYLEKGLLLNTVRNYLSLLCEVKYCNHKLLIRKSSHVYEINKEFLFHWERNIPASIVIEYLYKAKL